MEDQLITFETAKLAKDKGFDVDCNSYHESSEVMYRKGGKDNWNQYYEMWSAPTQSLLQKWLREMYNIHVTTISNRNTKWNYGIYDISKKSYGCIEDNYEYKVYKTYEEALEAGLYEGLNLIK